MVSLQEVLANATKNGRICPKPQKWAQLYELIPKKKSKGYRLEPSAPLILGAWWDTPAMLKMTRLREHIEWAADHACLEQVDAFLQSLSEEDWHHSGE